jgi:anaerobic ribonucleoside-triphosphate reductase activating protein
VKALYPEKSIWAFSGYLFDRDLLPGNLGDPAITKEFLGYLDVLVDGPFIESRKDLMLRFRGSDNQRLIDVPASLEQNTVVLWEDWQGSGRR